MMQNAFGAGAALGLVLWALPAAAQQVPHAEQVAVAFTLGGSSSSDEALDRGADLGAQVEYYLTPRVSIRGKVSSPWFDVPGRPFRGTISPMAVEGNLVHNWERGAWHPYVTGGVGLYRFRFREDGLDSSDTKPGMNFGGGIKYFFTRRDTLLAELTVRVAPGRAGSLRSDYETDYRTVAVGYKRYF